MTRPFDDNVTAILETLTWSVRVATLDQLQRRLNVDGSRAANAMSIVKRLSQTHLVSTTVTAAAFPDVMEPLCSPSPADPVPNFDALAWVLEKRWRAVQPRRVTLCWATADGARLLGGVAKFSRRSSQVEHDLGTADTCIRLWETQPDLAADWVGEDILRRDYATTNRWLSKTPDAAVIGRNTSPLVIEFGGQYSAKRLRRFHQHFCKHNLSYQLW